MRTYKYELTVKTRYQYFTESDRVSYVIKTFRGVCLAHNDAEVHQLAKEHHKDDLGTCGEYCDFLCWDITEQPRIVEDFCVFWKDKYEDESV